jgi:hypothetical protein
MTGATSASGASLRGWLLAALVAGLALRIGFALAQGGMYFPDEIYQYLEPAWARLHGFGELTWEYEIGARNWILPAFYGALMQVGETFGLRGWSLHRFLCIHDALLSTLVIPAGFRLGRAIGGDARSAILIGGGVALFPLSAFLAPHTLSDNYGLLFITWAYALWFESLELKGTANTASVGLLLGAGVAVRYALVAFVPVIVVGELLMQRPRALALTAIGFGAVLAFVGLVDALTWGRPFHSLIEFVRANGGGERWGGAPFWYYLTESMGRRVGAGAFLLVASSLVARKGWLVAAWLFPLLALSTLPHKLDRYILSIWPLLLASGLLGLLALRDRLAVISERWSWAALSLIVAWLWGTALVATLRQPMRLSAGIFAAQSDVGTRADASGLLVDGRSFWSPNGEPWLKGESRPFWNGGYTLMGRGIPMAAFRPELLSHSLYNYVLTGDEATAAALSSRPGFEIAGRYEGGVTLFHRRPGAP